MSILQELYHKRLSLISQYCPICPIGAHLVWKSPIYKFIIDGELDENEEQICKEIYINVTNSAPPFESPEDVLSNILNQVISLCPKKQKPLILDFGEGKSRNTLYLLEQGYNVRAVEFEEISNGTQQAKEMYEKAQSFGRQFDKLVFPHEFFESKEQFDLVLLVNVCPIMPVPAERLLVLKYCREKLKKDGIVFWYSIHNDTHMKRQCNDDVKIGDGYYMNKTKRYQTFYRDLDNHEVDCMFYSNGFREEKKITVPHNIAKIYKKVGNNPITEDVLNAEIIRQSIKGDEELEPKESVGIRTFKRDDIIILNEPNPDKLKEEQIYINALEQMKAGKQYATDFHNLIFAILIKLFIPPLQNPQIEKNASNNLERIDIVMTNNAKEGFFDFLINSHHIPAHYITIECKNYNLDLNNTQVQQLSSRLKPNRGKFGILVYRKTSDKTKLLAQCKIPYNEGKYIICLDDEDIKQLLNFKLEDAIDNINQFLDNKIQELDF